MVNKIQRYAGITIFCCLYTLGQSQWGVSYRDSVKKFRIKEIVKSELSPYRNGEREIFTYNTYGDAIKQVFHIVENDVEKLTDKIIYTYQYDHLNRPVLRKQYGVRYNTVPHTDENNPFVTDSIYTRWYYNNKGWTDSMINDEYASQLYTGDDSVKHTRYVYVYEYEPYKEYTILTEYTVIWENIKGEWRNRKASYSNDWKLFKDNPQQVLKMIKGCGDRNRGEASITGFHYVKKGNYTYHYKTTYGSNKCKLKAILKNDTLKIDHYSEGGAYQYRTDPLGRAVPDDNATFNTLGLLLKQCISPEYKLYWTFEYSFFE